jgi:hypothetical protein
MAALFMGLALIIVFPDIALALPRSVGLVR